MVRSSDKGKAIGNNNGVKSGKRHRYVLEDVAFLACQVGGDNVGVGGSSAEEWCLQLLMFKLSIGSSSTWLLNRVDLFLWNVLLILQFFC